MQRSAWRPFTHAWAPALAARQIPVAMKRKLIETRIVPTATYAHETWASRGQQAASASVDATLARAWRLAMGVRATMDERSWERGASNSPCVLESDLGALNARERCYLAHLRYAGRTTASAPAATQCRAPALDAGRMREGDTAKGTRFLVASRRRCNSGARPAQAASSRARRRCSAGALMGLHLNPVQKVLAPGAVEPRPGYIHAIPDVALPMCLMRSAHLAGDHTHELRRQCLEGCCARFGPEARAFQDFDTVSELERRWRVVQQHLLHCVGGVCPAHRLPLSMLRDDLLDAAAGYAGCRAAVRVAFGFMDRDAEAFALMYAATDTRIPFSYRSCARLSGAAQRRARSLLAGGWIHSCRGTFLPVVTSCPVVHSCLRMPTCVPVVHSCPVIHSCLRMPTCVPDLPGACELHACHIIAACSDVFYPLSKTRRTMARASPAARPLCLTLSVKLGGVPMPLTHMLLVISEFALGPPVRMLRPMLLVEWGEVSDWPNHGAFMFFTSRTSPWGCGRVRLRACDVANAGTSGRRLRM